MANVSLPASPWKTTRVTVGEEVRLGVVEDVPRAGGGAVLQGGDHLEDGEAGGADVLHRHSAPVVEVGARDGQDAVGQGDARRQVAAVEWFEVQPAGGVLRAGAWGAPVRGAWAHPSDCARGLECHMGKGKRRSGLWHRPGVLASTAVTPQTSGEPWGVWSGILYAPPTSRARFRGVSSLRSAPGREPQKRPECAFRAIRGWDTRVLAPCADRSCWGRGKPGVATTWHHVRGESFAGRAWTATQTATRFVSKPEV